MYAYISREIHDTRYSLADRYMENMGDLLGSTQNVKPKGGSPVDKNRTAGATECSASSSHSSLVLSTQHLVQTLRSVLRPGLMRRSIDLSMVAEPAIIQNGMPTVLQMTKYFRRTAPFWPR